MRKRPRIVFICFVFLTVVLLWAPLVRLLLRATQIHFAELPFAAAQFSWMQALLSSVLSMVFALGLTWVWVKCRVGGSGLRSLSFVYGLPSLVVTGAMLSVLPPQYKYSLTAVIVAHVWINSAWVSAELTQLWRALPREEWEVLRVSGAGSVYARGAWLLGRLRTGLLALWAQVFQLCLTSYTIVVLLGGGPPVETLESEIYSRIHLMGFDVSGAVGCAVLQWGIGTAVLWVVRRKMLPSKNSLSGDFVPASWGQKVLSFFTGSVWWMPLGWIFVSVPLSVWGDGEFWSELGPALLRGVMISASVALSSLGLTAVSFVLWRTGSEWQRSYIRWAATFPASVSTLMLALSLALVYGFRAPLWLLITTQCILFWPLTWRLGWARLVGWPGICSDAARLSGASATRTFWEIEWPHWRPWLQTALGMVWVSSLGELAAMSFFAPQGVVPFALWIRTQSAQYHFEWVQAALCVYLVLITGVVFVNYMCKNKV